MKWINGRIKQSAQKRSPCKDEIYILEGWKEVCQGGIWDKPFQPENSKGPTAVYLVHLNNNTRPAALRRVSQEGSCRRWGQERRVMQAFGVHCKKLCFSVYKIDIPGFKQGNKK